MQFRTNALKPSSSRNVEHQIRIRLKRSSATMLAWLCNVLPGDTSLHSLLLTARCTTQFDCGGSGCRNMFPERLVWQKATTAHHGWPVFSMNKYSSDYSLSICGVEVVSTPPNATISIEARRTSSAVFRMGRGVGKCFQSAPSGRQPHMRTTGGQ